MIIRYPASPVFSLEGSSNTLLVKNGCSGIVKVTESHLYWHWWFLNFTPESHQNSVIWWSISDWFVRKILDQWLSTLAAYQNHLGNYLEMLRALTSPQTSWGQAAVGVSLCGALGRCSHAKKLWPRPSCAFREFTALWSSTLDFFLLKTTRGWKSS